MDPKPEPSSKPLSLIDCIKKPENTLFVVQILVIFTIVIGAVVNLSISVENQQLWTTILIASLAYIIPNPQLVGPELLKAVSPPSQPSTSR